MLSSSSESNNTVASTSSSSNNNANLLLNIIPSNANGRRDLTQEEISLLRRGPNEVIQSFNTGALGSYQEFINKIILIGSNSSSAEIEAFLKHPGLDTSIIYKNNKTLLEYLFNGGLVNNRVLHGSFRLALVRVLQGKHPQNSATASSSSASTSSTNSVSSTLSNISLKEQEVFAWRGTEGDRESRIIEAYYKGELGDYDTFDKLVRKHCEVGSAVRIFRALEKKHTAKPATTSSSTSSSSTASTSTSSSFLPPLPPLPMSSLPIAASSSIASSAVETICSLSRKKFSGKDILHLDENSTEQNTKRERYALIVHKGTNPELLKKMGESSRTWHFCCVTNKEISAIPSVLQSYTFSPGMGMTIDSVKSINLYFDRVNLSTFTNPAVLHALPLHVKQASVHSGVTLEMLHALPDHVAITEFSERLCNSSAIIVSKINERARRINAAGKETHPIFTDRIHQNPLIKRLPLNAPHYAASTSLSALSPPKISSSTSASTSTTASTSSIQTLLSHNDTGNDNVAANHKKRKIDALSSNATSSSSNTNTVGSKRTKAIASLLSEVTNKIGMFHQSSLEEDRHEENATRMRELIAERKVYESMLIQFKQELQLLVSDEYYSHIEDPISRDKLIDPAHIGTRHVYNKNTLLAVPADSKGVKKCPMGSVGVTFTDSDIVSLPKDSFVKSNKFYDHVIAGVKERINHCEKQIAAINNKISEIGQKPEEPSATSSATCVPS